MSYLCDDTRFYEVLFRVLGEKRKYNILIIVRENFFKNGNVTSLVEQTETIFYVTDGGERRDSYLLSHSELQVEKIKK